MEQSAMRLDISAFKKPLNLHDVTDEVVANNNAAPISPSEAQSLPAVYKDEQSEQFDAYIDNLKIPIALRNCDLSAITSKPALMAVLSHNLPRNEYNMPKILYRPDVLDHNVFHLPEDDKPAESEDPRAPRLSQLDRGEKRDSDQAFQLMQELLDASTIILDYHEGYPSYLGTPVWKQFPWESTEDYELFTRYLDLPGARQLALLGNVDREATNELFHVNYWALRCLASDTFAVVHYKRMRERRILQTDDVHFLESERILRKLIAQIGEVKWDVLQDDPKTFVEVLERVAKIQRAALGTTERRADDERTIPSVELIMRKSAEHLAPLSAVEDVGGVDMAKILRDPQAVQDAQELILRIGSRESK